MIVLHRRCDIWSLPSLGAGQACQPGHRSGEQRHLGRCLPPPPRAISAPSPVARYMMGPILLLSHGAAGCEFETAVHGVDSGTAPPTCRRRDHQRRPELRQRLCSPWSSPKCFGGTTNRRCAVVERWRVANVPARTEQARRQAPAPGMIGVRCDLALPQIDGDGGPAPIRQERILHNGRRCVLPPIVARATSGVGEFHHRRYRILLREFWRKCRKVLHIALNHRPDGTTDLGANNAHRREVTNRRASGELCPVHPNEVA